jgi:Flp pilus assembly protein TadG
MRSRLRRLASGESGSALLLMPAAVLVLFLLAGVAVDAAVQFLGQRRVADLAASVAQDAVASVDVASFYEGAADVSELDLDRDAATARGQRLIDTLPGDDAFIDPRCVVTVEGVAATATCEAQVRLIFSGIVPGVSVIRDVSAVETAEGQQSLRAPVG